MSRGVLAHVSLPTCRMPLTQHEPIAVAPETPHSACSEAGKGSTDGMRTGGGLLGWLKRNSISVVEV